MLKPQHKQLNVPYVKLEEFFLILKIYAGWQLVCVKPFISYGCLHI